MHTYPTNELIGDVSIWTFDQSERSGRKPVLKSLFQGQTGEIVVDEKAYIKSTEWEIISKEGKIHEIKYDCCPATYQATYSINFDFTFFGSSTNSWQSAGELDCLSFLIHTFIKLGVRLRIDFSRFIEYVLDLTFYIKVKRFQYYPVMTLVVPCVMTAMLIVLTFILPPDAGEKVGLSKYPKCMNWMTTFDLRYHNSPCYGRFHGPVGTADTSHAEQIAGYRSGKVSHHVSNLVAPITT